MMGNASIAMTQGILQERCFRYVPGLSRNQFHLRPPLGFDLEQSILPRYVPRRERKSAIFGSMSSVAKTHADFPPSGRFRIKCFPPFQRLVTMTGTYEKKDMSLTMSFTRNKSWESDKLVNTNGLRFHREKPLCSM